MKFEVNPELKIYLGTIMTFVSYIVSSIGIDDIKNFITIGVGASTLSYTLYKLYRDVNRDLRARKIRRNKKE